MPSLAPPLPAQFTRRVKLSNALPGLLLTCLGLILYGHGLYMGAKAELSQILLGKAWTQSVKTGQFRTPWLGLDAYPIAKINFPDQNKSAIVLNTDSGQALAFGPGLVYTPTSAQSLVIAAHKNTHFKPLKDLTTDDVITLETMAGTTPYKITDQLIIDTRYEHLKLDGTPELHKDEPASKLVLVTCYPFNNISFNGPLRYVVYAEAITSS